MSRLASAYDFEPGEHRERALRTEPHPPMYSEYRRYPYFAERADWILRRDPDVRFALVAGAGFGYLVDELRQRDVAAMGIDASAYAVSKARQLIPHGDLYVHQADILDSQAVSDAVGSDFDLVVSEDLLTCAGNDDEARRMVDAMRPFGRQVLHIVTPGDPGDPSKLPGVLWKLLEDWKALVGDDTVLSTETWEAL